MDRFAYLTFSLALTLLVLTFTLAAPASARAESTAFFYGPKLPEELLTAFERVVVEPAHGHVPTRTPGRAELVAYLSIGEISNTSPDRAALQPSWILGQNEGWQSAIVDLTSAGYVRDLLERRFDGLWARGYRTFFLDTLDSYLRVAHTDQERGRQQTALTDLVRTLVKRRPEAKLLLNRGFELLPAVAGIVHGVVAESLFSAYDAATSRYRETSEADQRWLTDRLKDAQQRGLAVTVIDYAPPCRRERARDLARRIAALGFTPYVADGALSTVGVGPIEILPRRVLLLTAGPSDALALLSPVLEHLGYVVEPRDLTRGLPTAVCGTLAGIVTWLPGGASLPDGYGAFLRARIAEGVHVVMFGAPGLAADGADARALGFVPANTLVRPGSPKLTVRTRDALARFEAEPIASMHDVSPLRLEGAGVTEHLTFESAAGARAQALVSTSWGAWAGSHNLVPRGLEGEQAWTIDPFALIAHALGNTPFPVPDLTTENGRRLAMFVVRAAGLGEPSRLEGRPDTGAVLAALLARYPVPHALDLEPRADNRVTARDREAAARLLGPLVQREPLPVGRSRLSAERPSITQLAPLAELTREGLRVVVPMAGDYDYIPPGSSEAYPYRACAETLARSDTPRRLLPAALDYHASSLASDGGHDAIRALYERVLEPGALPITAREHDARVRGARAQVLLRDLEGAYHVVGSALPRTVRLPDSLGQVDLARSTGVASSDGRYLTFLPDGPRILRFAPAGTPPTPHVTSVNATLARVSRDEAQGSVRMRLSLAGKLDLSLAFAGLPAGSRYTLHTGARLRAQGRTNADGTLSVVLGGVRGGDLTLTVRREEAGR